ncbi:MAG TPA: ATP-binding protein [Ktedonobacteraceae bacterium]
MPLTLDDALTEGKCIARVDALRLRQAFSNLVKNAIKYSPRGGAIEVGLRLEGYPLSHALCWVSDHGVGIAQEDLPHLFERFYRSQNLDQALSGLGIGLYLVRQIITRHGGRLWVDSVQGQGSTFFLLLPCMY